MSSNIADEYHVKRRVIVLIKTFRSLGMVTDSEVKINNSLTIGAISFSGAGSSSTNENSQETGSQFSNYQSNNEQNDNAVTLSCEHSR